MKQFWDFDKLRHGWLILIGRPSRNSHVCHTHLVGQPSIGYLLFSQYHSYSIGIFCLCHKQIVISYNGQSYTFSVKRQYMKVEIFEQHWIWHKKRKIIVVCQYRVQMKVNLFILCFLYVWMYHLPCSKSATPSKLLLTWRDCHAPRKSIAKERMAEVPLTLHFGYSHFGDGIRRLTFRISRINHSIVMKPSRFKI